MPDKKSKRANQKISLGGKLLPSDVTSPLGIEMYDLFALQAHAQNSSLSEFQAAVRGAETIAKLRKLSRLAQHLAINVEVEGG